MLVATAGHIDHGKTLLVRALTGVDTDRLPEEKARGISIDLGFAYSTLPDGGLIGFVDVPGHERFVRNMLAGVCAIDLALLVVAADDGVMPQTVEHVQILDLLGVRQGLVAVSKADRALPDRIGQVTAQVERLLEATSLAGSPVLPVSAVSGAGIEVLRARLQHAAGALASRFREGQHFRLAIDRAFTVTGSGTVVTGTVFSGKVATGMRVLVSPGGTEARVRGIQVRGLPAERAHAGQRCALNLSGADLQDVSRGDWILDEPLHAPTQRLDLRLRLLPDERQALRHWSPVHVHLATAGVMGRISLAAGAPVEPGTTVHAQLVLDKPVHALNGDRFVLRDPSARRTIGGGQVLDPAARPLRRRAQARSQVLETLERHDPEAALAGLLEMPDCVVDLGWFGRIFNVVDERLGALCSALGAVVLGRDPRVAIGAGAAARLRERIVAALREYHRANPKADGQDPEVQRRALCPQLPAPAFHALLRGLADERLVEIRGDGVRLRGHDSTSNPEDEDLWERLLPVLLRGAFTPPTLGEVATTLGATESAVKSLLLRKAKSGEVVRVGGDRYYPRATLARLAATAAAVARSASGGVFTAAQYRDAVGTGRTIAIRILECLDALTITQRLGDVRKIRKDFVAILGPAEPEPALPQGTGGRGGDGAPRLQRSR